MSFSSDASVDRRKLKRRLGVWRIVAIVALAGLALALLTPRDGLFPRNYIARIDIEGLITNDQDRDRALGRIADDHHVRALIVYIDSPGGTVVGGEVLFRELRKIARHKPVVAVMGTVAASGGYMTALGADRIFAQPGTITGSIGVILQTANVTGLLDKLGIKPETIKSAPLKAVPNPLEPLTPEGRAATRTVVMDMYRQFVSMVAERRGFTEARAKALADGRIFTGRQAVANKLIDAIGGVAEARQWLAKARHIPLSLPVHDVQVHQTRSDLLDLIEHVTGKALFSERLTLDGLVSVWHPDLN